MPINNAARLSALLLISLLVACDKKAPPPAMTAPIAPAAPVTGTPAPAPATPPVPGAPVAAPTATSTGEKVEMPVAPGQKNETPENFDVNISLLQSQVDSFMNEFKKPPTSVEQMKLAGYLSNIPVAPGGKKYVIDQTTGKVSSR